MSLFFSELLKQEALTGCKGQDARILRIFYASAKYLDAEYDQNMDVDTAKFAVDAYTARNHACHSKSQNLKIVEDWPRLGHQISQDLEELASVLPDGEVQHYEKWQRIICYFRDRHMERETSD